MNRYPDTLIRPVSRESSNTLDLNGVEFWTAGRDALVQHLLQPGRFLQLVTLNADMLLTASRDPEMREVLHRPDTLCTIDGVGAGLALNWFEGARLPRIPGVELCEQLLNTGVSVYLLGARPEVNRELAADVGSMSAELAGSHHGYFDPGEEPEIVREITASGAELLLVALGSPKQEKFIHRHREELGELTAIGAGGSFDVLAGRAARAPESVSSLGLEWLWRNLSPGRWNRLARVVKFGFWLLKLRLTGQAPVPPEQT